MPLSDTEMTHPLQRCGGETSGDLDARWLLPAELEGVGHEVLQRGAEQAAVAGHGRQVADLDRARCSMDGASTSTTSLASSFRSTTSNVSFVRPTRENGGAGR